MGAANFGGAGMAAFAASRVRNIKGGGGNSNDPKNNDWWIPLVVAIIATAIVVSLYFI